MKNERVLMDAHLSAMRKECEMKTALRSIVYEEHSVLNTPQITVMPHEIFMAETEMNSGGWLLSEDETWAPKKSRATNPAVCIGIEGASPGDMLAVEIIDIIPDKLGYTGFFGDNAVLPNRIKIADWGLNTKTVKIENGIIHWSDAIKLPACPMIGVLGTAPKTESLKNTRGGPHGGNMDVQEVCAGSIVYLPVETEGALLHIGDVHALQGDGEINGAGGIECRSTVKMKAWLMKRPKNFLCARIEDKTHIMTVACERTAEESFYTATEQLIQWMVDDYKFSLHEAYLFLGQVMEARCTQFVNPTSSYICKIAKKYLIVE